MLSNLKINHSNSNTLNITLPPDMVSHSPSKRRVFCQKTQSHTLELKIPTSLSNLFKYNFTTILKETRKDLKCWNVLNIFWFGRASLLKITILPCFLYLLQIIPIWIPSSFFLSFRQACSSFIWRGKLPRIKFDCLTLPKNKGGIALPNLRRYYWATHLSRVVDWNIHHTVKDWFTLEHLVSPQSLSSLPWMHPKYISSHTKLHPLTGPTLEVFHISTKVSNPTPWLGRYPHYVLNQILLQAQMTTSLVRSGPLNMSWQLIISTEVSYWHWTTPMPN